MIGNKLLEVSTMLKVIASRDETPMDSMNISALYAEISLAFSDLPPLEQLHYQKNVTALFFLSSRRRNKTFRNKIEKAFGKSATIKKKSVNTKN